MGSGNLKKEVLVIDDNDVIHMILTDILEREGFEVSSCQNGSSAVSLSREHRFPIYLVDYRLPEVKGDIVTAELRKMQPDALIIGYSIELKEGAFVSAGADKFILKESLPAELIPSIRTLMASRGRPDKNVN